MTILVLTKGGERVASSRVRIWQLFRRLEERDVSATIIHSLGYAWWSVSAKRFRALKSIVRALHEKPNLVFVHKSLFPWDVVLLVVWWCRIKKIPYIYDCDDAEWSHSPRKTNYLMRHAAVVFAGSQHIQQYATTHASRVELVPSVVDYELYAGITHDSDPPVIVWVGHGPAHLKSGNFKVLRDALRELAKHGVSFVFALVGGKHEKNVHAYWGHEAYPVKIIDELAWEDVRAVPGILEDLRPVIGVMPLTDSPFVRAKCAYKAIEYMAAGIPVIASPVGEAIPLITDSGAGALAQDAHAWAETMEQLLEDESLRDAMGKKGQDAIKMQYSYDEIVPRVRQIFTQLTQGHE